MPKKMKLDLGGLKVNSFVTSLESREREKIKGGEPWTKFGTCSCDGGCHTVRQFTCDSCNTCNSEPDCCAYSGTTCEVCGGTTPDVCGTN